MSGNGHGKRGCTLPRLTVAEIEEHFGELVELIAFEDDAVELVRVKLRESQKDHEARVAKALEAHRRQLVQAEEGKKRAFALAIDGGIDPDTLREKTAELDADIARTRSEVARLEGESRTYYDEGIRVIELAQRMHRIWLAQDSVKKREILDCLNCTSDGVRLTPKWRRPSHLLAERPSLASNRGSGI
jgi:hypothetical protein